MSNRGQFSGALQLSNVNDFLGPSQECIKPVEVVRTDPTMKSTIEVGNDGVYREVMEDGSVKALQKAKITLADCLACSGCVTTAESILVEAQSVSELKRVLARTDEAPKLVVVSISPQTLASIATTCFMTMTEVYYRLNSLFTTYYRANYICDITQARNIALLEAATEFVSAMTTETSRLPLLASACPGWICYAEKNSSSDVLHHISTVKSPQQIMGSLVKHKLLQLHPDILPSQVYHISLMPCWDKKLEASRQDFYSEAYRSHDVDLVLTSNELPQLLEEAGIASFDLLPLTPIQHPLFNTMGHDETSGNPKVVGVSGTSGSFAEHIFKYAAQHLFSENVGTVELKTLVRPKGVKEVKLVKDGRTLLSVATAYGFSNIANVVKTSEARQQQVSVYRGNGLPKWLSEWWRTTQIRFIRFPGW